MVRGKVAGKLRKAVSIFKVFKERMAAKRREKKAKREKIEKGMEGFSDEYLQRLVQVLGKQVSHLDAGQTKNRYFQTQSGLAVKNALDLMGIVNSAKRRRVHTIMKRMNKRLAMLNDFHSQQRANEDSLIKELKKELCKEFDGLPEATRFFIMQLSALLELKRKIIKPERKN